MVYNEAYACFYSDIREKKQAGRGIYNKTFGKPKSNWHKDNYTNKEKKEMNGKVYEINVKNPQRLTYAEFQKLPTELQVEWLKAVDAKYGVGSPTLAKAMETSDYVIRHKRKQLGVPLPATNKGTEGKQRKRRLYEDWGIIKAPNTNEPNHAKDSTPKPQVSTNHNDRNEMTTTFVDIIIEGKIKAEEVVRYINQFKDTEVVLRLNITKKQHKKLE